MSRVPCPTSMAHERLRDQERTVTQERATPPRCLKCDEPIGVYEPMMVLVDGGARETSRAREPLVLESADSCFHRDCFDAE